MPVLCNKEYFKILFGGEGNWCLFHETKSQTLKGAIKYLLKNDCEKPLDKEILFVRRRGRYNDKESYILKYGELQYYVK